MCSLTFLTLLSLWFCITKDFIKQLRWFKSSILPVVLNHPLTLDSTFLHSPDPLMSQSCSVPVQQNKQAQSTLFCQVIILLFQCTALAHQGLDECQTCHKRMTSMHGQEKEWTFGSNAVSLLSYENLTPSYERLVSFLAFAWSIYLSTRDGHSYHLVAPSFEGNASPSFECVLNPWYMVTQHTLKNAEN